MAEPAELPRLALYREFESIHDRIYSSTNGKDFRIFPRFSTPYYRLHDYLLMFKPDIVHFSGHGLMTGQLAFENEQGKLHVANLEAIANLFDILKGRISLVFLNSCYSERQARMISEYVDVVIGVSQRIMNLAAFEFSVNFYYGLAEGLTIKESFELGRHSVRLPTVSYDPKKQMRMIHIMAKRNEHYDKRFVVNPGRI
jgi:CHAT domain